MTDEPLDQFMQQSVETARSHREAIDEIRETLAELTNARPTASAERGRQAEPDALPEGTSERPRGPAKVLGHASRPSDTYGFETSGQFFMAVKNAGVRGGGARPRPAETAASRSRLSSCSRRGRERCAAGSFPLPAATGARSSICSMRAPNARAPRAAAWPSCPRPLTPCAGGLHCPLASAGRIVSG